MTGEAPAPIAMASAHSAAADALAAAHVVAARCAERIGRRRVDAALVFASAAHVPVLGRVVEIVQRELGATLALGVSAQGVIEGADEIEGVPALSLLAMVLPGARFAPFTTSAIVPHDTSPEGIEHLGRAIGAADDLRATFLFIDPFSVPIGALLPALNKARASTRGVIVGGIASASRKPGGNALVLNDHVAREGLVGFSILGPVRVDTVVSQGCRPFGRNLIVTGAKNNVITTLGGRPALDAAREAVESMPEDQQQNLSDGLMIGRVVDEYKQRFGRGDYLVRNVMGVDPNIGALAIQETVRVGQTVRFHVRDARTADEDLGLLLDAQRLYDPPAGAILIASTSRGRNFFGSPNHDAAAVVRALARTPPAEGLGDVAGSPESRPGIPLAGFFSAGEIGPVGDQSFIHGHSACVALFREAM